MGVDLLPRGAEPGHRGPKLLGLTEADRAPLVQEDDGLDVRVLLGLLHPLDQVAERGPRRRAEGERLIGGEFRHVPRQPEHGDPRLGRGRLLLRRGALGCGTRRLRLVARFVASRERRTHPRQVGQQARRHREGQHLGQSRFHRSFLLVANTARTEGPINPIPEYNGPHGPSGRNLSVVRREDGSIPIRSDPFERAGVAARIPEDGSGASIDAL